MSDFDRSRSFSSRATAATDIDAGLRSYMLRVYNYMAVGLLITAGVGFLLHSIAETQNPAEAVVTLRNGVMLTAVGQAIYSGVLRWVIMLAPLGVIFLFYARINSMSSSSAQLLFWVYAALVGASLSFIFVVYTGAAITQMFLITSAAFAGLSLWGYTTKRDLTGMGSFLLMGLFGVILAVVVNIFLKSPALQYAISGLCVLIFAGLTAYDTQKLKDYYYSYSNNGEALGRSAVIGALNLYLDFINMFLALLQIFGDRR